MRTMTMEFHISRQARERYDFDQTLFSLTGNVILADFHAVRQLAHKMNQRRNLALFPERAVKAGQINAMGLIDEILHLVAALYRQQENVSLWQQALDWLDDKLGQDQVEETLRRFVDDFPPRPVYSGEADVDAFLAGRTGAVDHREAVLEELLMLWLANGNPAFAPFCELFDDERVERETAYRQVLSELHGFFDTQAPFGPDWQNLIDMLRSPAVAVPHSLSGQLEYIRERWGFLLGRHFYRLLSSLDLVQEEEKAVFLGPGPARIYEFAGLELEPERFSRDLDWMPRLVLLAKNAYVWLDQLSRKYRRAIDRLDLVPEEELDTLARWGITGLWLIGLWERSPASKRIKQLCGNLKAVASAYSIYDYRVAGDLGGEEAYQTLRDKAWRRGIRLASDMVPNHMGIDSPWVIEHPDRFLSLDYSPFPAYTFSGPDLSSDSRVGIFLEDHYYDRSDAAVVFKRVDRWTGSERYVYHGNDGTRMPWNDTAQLNYLNPEVREAAIQAILGVARRFPIIRFDAAMTLAKKHYQRLWFPEPGSGGDIPSRAEHGLSKQQFDAAMPEEFWREVVDRVAQEAPDTLLLAEAFWLMEGYFVRTLGMHRVYNSAFMNMLRDELNANYRTTIKNTLEFDPEILKRFVNFMNNPDEETAVAQFGTGDKYFGTCTMMATMPGLPMIGHGQVEGYTEKYGMEYRYTEWDEKPDPYLVERHEREIFPLLRRRHLFAQVESFLLYDFFAPEGFVNEDVFAYSNRSGGERSLVVYHNRYATAKGWVRTSVAYLEKGPGDERALVQKTLGEGLALHRDGNYYCLFRDHLTGLTYIRNSRELFEKGLYAELDAYKCHVFLDFREVEDNEWHQYAQLAAYLGGRGVPSIEAALQEILLQPVHQPFRELVHAGLFQWLLDSRLRREPPESAQPLTAVLDEVEEKALWLLQEVKALAQGDGDAQEVARQVRQELELILRWPLLPDRLIAGEDGGPELKEAVAYLQSRLDDDRAVWGTLLAWLFVHPLGKVVRTADYAQQGRSWIDEWLLGRITAHALGEFGLDEGMVEQALAWVKLLTTHQRWFTQLREEPGALRQVLEPLLADGDVQYVLRVNRYQGVLWFNKEALEELCWWLLLVTAVDALADPGRPAAEAAGEVIRAYEIVQCVRRAADESDYQVEKLLKA